MHPIARARSAPQLSSLDDATTALATAPDARSRSASPGRRSAADGLPPPPG